MTLRDFAHRLVGRVFRGVDQRRPYTGADIPVEHNGPAVLTRCIACPGDGTIHCNNCGGSGIVLRRLEVRK